MWNYSPQKFVLLGRLASARVERERAADSIERLHALGAILNARAGDTEWFREMEERLLSAAGCHEPEASPDEALARLAARLTHTKPGKHG